MLKRFGFKKKNVLGLRTAVTHTNAGRGSRGDQNVLRSRVSGEMVELNSSCEELRQKLKPPPLAVRGVTGLYAKRF